MALTVYEDDGYGAVGDADQRVGHHGGHHGGAHGGAHGGLLPLLEPVGSVWEQ